MTTLDNKINFKKVAELWIKKKETSTKDSTYIHYYNLLKNHIEPKLGDEIIEDITLLKLEETIITFSTEGRLDYSGGLSATNIAVVYTDIKNFLYMY